MVCHGITKTCSCNIQRYFFSDVKNKISLEKCWYFDIFAQNIEAVLTSIHSLCFGLEIRKICIPLLLSATSSHVFCQNVGWYFIIQFHDLFLATEYHSGLNLLIVNDSHLLFLIFQISSIGFNAWKVACHKMMRKELVYLQGNVLCINSKTAKHILYIRGIYL